MKPKTIIRIARPTDNLVAIAEMYIKGLGFSLLSEFQDHQGFDGIIIGHPNNLYHLEFTCHKGHLAGKAPTKDNLLVFYVPDKEEWEKTCSKMLVAGFLQVTPYNPYWDQLGKTFEDLDGYRIVLQNAAWSR